MTFNYQSNHATDLDRVRFHIRDVESGNGPLPDDANYADEEIAAVLASEGDWHRAVAAMFESLAAAWRKYPNLNADQFGISRSHISRGYDDMAASWRKRWGYAGDPLPSVARRAYSVALVRVDGFGDDETA